MTTRRDQFKRVEVKNLKELRTWLSKNHKQTDSVWLVTYKKQAGDKYLAKDDIVDEALCWGWIDSLPRKLDDERTMVMLSPRKLTSVWSRINKDKVSRLERAGRMRPAGRHKIDAAKANGMWDFLDDVEAMIKPADLVEALAEHSKAAANFDAFPAASQKGILQWIKQAKKLETRQKRVAETARLAAKNIMANHPPSMRQR
ncbi:MAG: YdeI/OmpD-associated family protein [Pseudomonadota bacterium]